MYFLKVINEIIRKRAGALNQKFSFFFHEGSFAPVFGMMSLALMTISVMMRLFYKPAKIIRIITKTRT